MMTASEDGNLFDATALSPHRWFSLRRGVGNGDAALMRPASR